ncbi:MAG: hypothetical protein H6779_04925 [Candidatus Nomurabacteria bacterium]|nr:hypothetical protein [Candidatus Nomurabacteria bacterium]USN87711.1 MAG: hypothetical protein H6779_04925 [Candidatus Nomurabacteria bacterium]
MNGTNILKLFTTGEQIYDRVRTWDLSKIKEYVVSKGLCTDSEIDAIEAEYKRYLAICFTFPEQAFPTPAKIDILWHQHILFTQDYADMCEITGGRFLHHFPFSDDKMFSLLDNQLLKQKYVDMFGEKPNSLWDC